MRSTQRSAGIWIFVFSVALGLNAILAPQPAPAAPDSPDLDPALISQFSERCLSDNPFFITTCFAIGDRRNEPALVAFRDTPDDSDHHVIARSGDIGASYGLAHLPGTPYIYAAAYLKRGSAFGPGGPGAVYRVNIETDQVETFITVPNVGTNLHNSSRNYWPDRPAIAWVGRASLGDIDLDEAGETLYVVNMFERRIHRYSVADRSKIQDIEIGSAGESWAEDGRPHGLKVWNGKLFHGVIDAAERSMDRADLSGHVYVSELDGSDMREVVSFDLGYVRGNVAPPFDPWHDNFNWRGPPRDRDPAPMFSDIEFGDDGHMILGIRDRLGDMTFMDNNTNGNPPGEVPGRPTGEVLLALRAAEMDLDDPSTWRWEAQLPPPEVFIDNSSGHEETSFGGLGRIWAIDRFAMTGNSPLRILTGGAYWFESNGGPTTAREELYQLEPRDNFGKANGLGDVEIICPAGFPTPTPTTTSTPTVTNTPTNTPTATDIPTVTPTSTPTEYIVYLPLLEKSKVCISDAYHTDVVLVLDRSTSMLRPVEPGGIQKNTAAIEAAKAFVELLDFEPDFFGRQDQVAVVGFNNDAWIEEGLSQDKATALAALDRISGRTKEGTRLDLAFLWGQKPLDMPERKPENRPVIIMLTDGLPNRVPFGDGSPYPGSQRQEDSVLIAVEEVKTKGSRVYTVGVGTPYDILPWLLIDSASERWMYYYAPRPEDLAGIYAQIAQTFNSCDPAPPPKICVPEEVHADIVLILDMSTSMYRTTRSGRTKLEAAVEAAKVFVDQLDLQRNGWGEQDQVGIVGFNNEAWTAIGLSDDKEAVLGAIDGLLENVAEGTRLDLALYQGQSVFTAGPRLKANDPVSVLLTDGLPNRVPFGEGTLYPQCLDQECTVLAVASLIKSQSTEIFSIGLGLGDDVLRPLMEGVASRPDMYYFAPDGEDLEEIYRQIAGRIQECPD